MALSAGTITVNAIVKPSFITGTGTAGWIADSATYDEYLYGRANKARTFIPADAPPIQHERLDAIERMMTGPRPVPDYPIPLFVGDYVNGIFLPADWDPKGHLEGESTWQNRTRFFSEGRLWNYKRIPLAPRLPGS